MLLVVGIVVALRLVAGVSEDINAAEEVERDLRLRTGGTAGEDAYELARLLIAEGTPREEAVNVAGTLSYLGADALKDMRTARLLAQFEQSASAKGASRDLVKAAQQMEVDRDGLWSFLNLVAQEGTERQMPVEQWGAALREHEPEYAEGCAIVERSPCPVEVVVGLVLDRQQADYRQWGHVDCRRSMNTAHPGCVTFADCADEFGWALAASVTNLDARETATALGHEPGSAGFEEWTALTGEAARSASEAHEACISERYGEGNDAYRALVLPR